MKLFRPQTLTALPLPAKLAADRVGFDLKLVRFARPTHRAPFRQTLRASIQRLREELRRAS